MTQFSEKIIEKIRQQHICPTPKWCFLLKNYVIWTAFGISVFLDSVSFSVIADMISRSDWDVTAILGTSKLAFLLTILPYIWILFLCGFLFVAFYNWKYTRGAYRYHTYAVIIGSMAASAVLGGVFYSVGLGKTVDEVLTHNVPYYHKAKKDAQREVWMHPDKGLLAGQIVEAKEDGNLVVEDHDGKKWEVKPEGCSYVKKTISGDETTTREVSAKERIQKKGKTIKVIGKKMDDENEESEKNEEAKKNKINVFIAKEIREADDDGDEAEIEKD